MFLRMLQTALILLVAFEIIGVGVAMQITADHRLGFVPFGDLYGADAAGGADPGVVSHEIDEVGTLQQQLRHDGVVVALRR